MNWSGDMASPYIIAPMLAWITTQIIKVIIKGRAGTWDWRNIYRSGNMPSSHAAVVVSLATVVLHTKGFNSAEFGIAAVFAGIVMYDALNVRQAVGEQGRILQRLLAQYNKSHSKRINNIRESLGHKPIEVLAGSIIGVILAIIVIVV